MGENIHSETYSLLIEQYIRDPAEKERIFDAIHTMPAVSEKAQWAVQWMQKENSFAERVLAFAAVEGILFSGSFCAIYWLKNRLPDKLVHDIIKGAVDTERRFICEALSCDLIGMNSELMTKYIEFVADRLLTALGHPKLFGSSNP